MEMATPATMAMAVSNGRWMPAPHLMLLDQVITKAIEQGSGRIMVSMPPRHGKSEYCSKYLPAWSAIRRPDKRTIIASYGQDLSRKFGRSARELVVEHGAKFGITVAQDSKAAHSWDIQGNRGGMESVGVGGSLTGKGADLLIIDDPIKNAEEAASETVRQGVQEWYESTAYTRLEPGGTIVIVMTRWHESDLCGWLLEQKGHRWQQIVFPAIAEEYDELGRDPGDPLWPERFDWPVLDEIRREVGPYYWAAMFQQRPSPLEGGMFQRIYFANHLIPKRFQCDRVRFWDLAATIDGDYTSGVKLAATAEDYPRIVIEDVKRGRWKPSERDQIIMATAERDGREVPVVFEEEPGSAGKSVSAYFKRLLNARGFACFSERPTGDPVQRCLPFQAVCDDMRVIVANELWTADFINEFIGFPNAKHDDQVQSTCQGYNWLAARSTAGISGGGERLKPDSRSPMSMGIPLHRH